ncbi:MAG: hypothetical protein V7L26_14115 [Nostoc sp.]|uniref:hypothetical protein n=1 Tax=Nostoc sp. TaxID=1180 RepID=UPI002FF29946
MTTKVFNRPHIIVPEEDTTWAIEQRPCVLKFWQQCWLADPYGSRWMKLTTNLSDSAFRLGRRILEATRLFLFRRISVGSDGRTSFWEVRNLHGARVKDFWRGVKNEADTASNKADIAPKKTITASNKAPILAKTQSKKAFQEPSGTPQEHITNSSKEFVMCVSSTPNEISLGEETAHTPLGGASPQPISVEETEKESPMATDCTSLTLVDDAPSQPAPKRTENQDCGVEVRDCHVRAASRREGICSAVASIAEEEKELTQSEIFEWLDRADVGECPPLWVIQYLLDSKYYASMRATLSKFEKRWNVSVVNYQVQKSSEAMPQAVNHAARSKVKSLRMEKLKMALMVGGEKPDFDFLQECWNDDPALRIIIKQMIAKYPVWGIVCVDGVLVDWNKE